ncbi:MAG: phosphohydrolase, partial [bacterium]|nr:phosphohydrolase [bacterium]
MDAELEQLIEVIEEVARGNYSDKVMQLTKPEHPEPIRRIAEAVGMMMVQVEAREMRLEGLVQELKLLNEKTRENAVQAVGSMATAL